LERKVLVEKILSNGDQVFSGKLANRQNVLNSGVAARAAQK
jgi:hypothetical protein